MPGYHKTGIFIAWFGVKIFVKLPVPTVLPFAIAAIGVAWMNVCKIRYMNYYEECNTTLEICRKYSEIYTEIKQAHTSHMYVMKYRHLFYTSVLSRPCWNNGMPMHNRWYRWRPRVGRRVTLLSLMAPEVVVTTTSGAISDNKVGIIMLFSILIVWNWRCLYFQVIVFPGFVPHANPAHTQMEC